MISSLIGGGLTVDQSERTALLRASSLLPRGRGDTRGVHRGHGDSAERCCEGVHRGTGSLQRDVVRGVHRGHGVSTERCCEGVLRGHGVSTERCCEGGTQGARVEVSAVR